MRNPIRFPQSARFRSGACLLALALCSPLRSLAAEPTAFQLADLKTAPVAVWPLPKPSKFKQLFSEPTTEPEPAQDVFPEMLSGRLIPACAPGSLGSSEVAEILARSGFSAKHKDPARLIKAAGKGDASSFEALRQIPEFQSIHYVVLLRDLKITLVGPIPEGVPATVTVSGQAVRPTRHPVSYFGYVVPTILDLRTERIVWETPLKARPEGKYRNHHAEVQESLLRQFLDPILQP